jgi:cysteinyl-tRNA synthetase
VKISTDNKNHDFKSADKKIAEIGLFLDGKKDARIKKSPESFISERWKLRARDLKINTEEKKLPKDEFLKIPYRYEPDDNHLSEDKVKEIERLIEQREEFRKFEKFDEADAVRLKLRDEYGVICNDRKRMWRVRPLDYIIITK